MGQVLPHSVYGVKREQASCYPVGRKVARDPYIIKGQGGGYYMLATDLKGGDKTQELTNKGRIFGAPIPVLPPGILRSW